MSQEFLDIIEVAELLRLSKRVIAKLIESGQLPGYNFHGHYRVTQQDLEDFISRCRRG